MIAKAQRRAMNLNMSRLRAALRASSLAAMSATLLGCGDSRPSLTAMERPIDLQRYMGDWYVIASIPLDLPLLSEADAFNAVESYQLRPDGTIATTYTFRRGGFNGPEQVMRPVGWVHDSRTNTHWKMQFLWPFAADYLILYLADDYSETIVGVPDRSHVWLMARQPEMSEGRYLEHLDRIEQSGHDLTRLRRVPQRWDSGAPVTRIEGSEQ